MSTVFILLKVTWCERVGLAALLVPEPVSKLEPLELISDQTLEGGSQKGTLDLTLHDASNEEINVIDRPVELLKSWHHLKVLN